VDEARQAADAAADAGKPDRLQGSTFCLTGGGGKPSFGAASATDWAAVFAYGARAQRLLTVLSQDLRGDRGRRSRLLRQRIQQFRDGRDDAHEAEGRQARKARFDNVA
jgi:hypothetical protein